MPRKSPEAIAASLYRTGVTPPEPPKDLSAAAQKVWRRLAGSRPGDWFDPAGQELLKRLCRTLVTAEAVHDQLDQAMGTTRAENLIKLTAQLNASVKALAVALRLTPQARIDWHSGQKDERWFDDEDGLLGGAAIWQGKNRLIGGHARNSKARQ
jgi:phage terminase small subunit